jgi:sugar phosphate isomerase/epimerase
VQTVTARQPSAPRVICSTVSVFSKPAAEAFAVVAAAGFDGIEVMVTGVQDTQDAGRLRELASAHDLPVRVIHAPFLLTARKVWGTDPIGKIDRAIELAEDVGAGIVVIHPPYRWQSGYRRWLDEQLPHLAERTDVKVAVENMFPLRVRGRKVATFHARQGLDDLERFPHVVLDTSHAAVAGLDLREALARMGSRLVHVHLSNNAGKGWDSHLPLDQGVLDLETFLDALAASGFGGTISLELDLRRYLADPEALHEVLISSREFCQRRLALPA